ncbi:MAG: TlyA family RNA methyltransferase [Oscillospiraceae bacterium]|nr:TlyA family RNA methyltransferase [Oscillospiraceae bacterium]MCL2278943.1 TlyA family RNA methyltransferase [Oscillospiraceae bacterium]
MSTAEHDILSGLNYVSRGGTKLEKAISHFNVSAEHKVCIDCGASTGGFTDCLLQNGAKKVYAVDVGYGQLAWTLRNDPRVVTMERTNIRYVTPEMLDESPQLAVIDVAFISLALVLPVVHKLLTDESEVICLIKPQFEAGKGKVGKKGVVSDPQTHKEVLDAFIGYSEGSGFLLKGLSYSPIKGPKGNIEFLSHLSKTGEKVIVNTDLLVKQSHEHLC